MHHDLPPEELGETKAGKIFYSQEKALEAHTRRYFNLYLKDWIARHDWDREIEEEIFPILLDFAHFIFSCAHRGKDSREKPVRSEKKVRDHQK